MKQLHNITDHEEGLPQRAENLPSERLNPLHQVIVPNLYLILTETKYPHKYAPEKVVSARVLPYVILVSFTLFIRIRNMNIKELVEHDPDHF